MVSYNRFIELSHRQALAFMLFLQFSCKGECTEISFIDSTVLRVCHNKRIKRNKVFKDVAAVGKSTMGWFFGFELHLIVNDKGEILSFYLTKGNTDDRDVKTITEMTKEILGKLFGDKGNISKALSDLLFGNRIQLITQVKRNMKKQSLSNEDKLLFRKRSVIETVNVELKNICQVEYTRHRSISCRLLNIMGAIAAYSFFPKKPSIKRDIEETNPQLINALEQLFFLAASTEPRLINDQGLDTYQTRKELYYALEAINRLDLNAESYFNLAGTSKPNQAIRPPSSDLNGFFIRDDMTDNFVGAAALKNTILQNKIAERIPNLFTHLTV